MSEITLEVAQRFFHDNFAPWIQDLDVRIVAIGNGGATLRIPSSPRIYRVGGTVCGQAILALADTAMVFAVASAAGGFVPMTTVGQTTSFLRPAAKVPLLADARVIKSGRQIVYGEVTLHTGQPDKPTAHVTSTYMLL